MNANDFEEETWNFCASLSPLSSCTHLFPLTAAAVVGLSSAGVGATRKVKHISSKQRGVAASGWDAGDRIAWEMTGNWMRATPPPEKLIMLLIGVIEIEKKWLAARRKRKRTAAMAMECCCDGITTTRLTHFSKLLSVVAFPASSVDCKFSFAFIFQLNFLTDHRQADKRRFFHSLYLHSTFSVEDQTF